MKSNGIARKVDELGRITIPMELCKKLDIVRGQTFLEILSEGEKIMLQHVQKPACVFCRKERELFMHQERYICKKCLMTINKYQSTK